VRNLFKYARAFGGQDPVLSEEAIFRVTLMLPNMAHVPDGALTGGQPEQGAESGAESESQDQRVLAALNSTPLGKTELARVLGLPAVSGALNRSVRRLLVAEWIELTVPDKPASRLQKYRLTPAGQALVSQQQSSR
jgi:ATP-dependent DNA helicase RecG